MKYLCCQEEEEAKAGAKGSHQHPSSGSSPPVPLSFPAWRSQLPRPGTGPLPAQGQQPLMNQGGEDAVPGVAQCFSTDISACGRSWGGTEYPPGPEDWHHSDKGSQLPFITMGSAAADPSNHKILRKISTVVAGVHHIRRPTVCTTYEDLLWLHLYGNVWLFFLSFPKQYR